MNVNIYNPYVKAELELYHHGIAGMKWGKKNGPPYPLGASDHSASEKKAGWRKSLDTNRTSKKRKTSKYKQAKEKYKESSSKYKKYKSEYRQAKKEYRNDKTSENRKKVASARTKYRNASYDRTVKSLDYKKEINKRAAKVMATTYVALLAAPAIINTGMNVYDKYKRRANVISTSSKEFQNAKWVNTFPSDYGTALALVNKRKQTA